MARTGRPKADKPFDSSITILRATGNRSNCRINALSISSLTPESSMTVPLFALIRYSEGAEMYSMSVSKFMQLAKDAKACYKVNQLVLVNLDFLQAIILSFLEKRACSTD